MSPRARTIGLAAGALAGTFWLGTTVASHAGHTTAAPPAEQRAAGPRVVAMPSAPSPGLTREDLRAVVREELAAQRAAVAAAPGEAAPAAPRDDAKVERIASAREAAHAVVSDALERGVWGANERQALRMQLVGLDEASLHEVLTPLFNAINAQQLKVDGPPI